MKREVHTVYIWDSVIQIEGKHTLSDSSKSSFFELSFQLEHGCHPHQDGPLLPLVDSKKEVQNETHCRIGLAIRLKLFSDVFFHLCY